MTHRILATVAATSLWLAAAPAAADDDERACLGLAQGDACVDDDGEPGTCLPDDDDGHLECEDDDAVDDLDDDERACLGLAQGDACVDDDGEPGTCLPDDDDGRLECEDDAARQATASSAATDGSSGSSGCSVGAAPAAGLGFVGLGWLVAAGALARRRRRG